MFQTKSTDSVSFAGSSLIKGRWKVLKKIGAGAFGEIFSGKNVITNEMVAIKVERVDNKKQVLKLEVAVLKKLQACPFVCRFITCGRFNEYNYLIMELLGENLSELRRRQPDGRFSMGTAIKLGIQMMKALEAVHDLGYIHRDVKPSNYAMGLTGVKRHTTFLIDFGLARRYLLSSGEVRPPRDSTGFRGTARYASINSHLSKDLGRRDDLWSIFYMLIEFVQGQLPWRKLKDKDQIGDMKVKYNTPELVKDLPPQFLAFMKHLKSLQYADRPDYNHLYNILLDLYHSVGCDDHTPFDWEVGAPLRSPQYPPTPLVSSNNDVEFSRGDHKSNAPLNPQSRATLEEIGSPDTLSPQPSQHSLPHQQNNGNNNYHAHDRDSRRDSASVIAASTSEEKETGSWEKKSSPMPSTTPIKSAGGGEDAHLKVTPLKPKQPTEKADSVVPPESSANKHSKHNKGRKDKSQGSSCHCIIM
jgi:tau tubulin kinase